MTRVIRTLAVLAAWICAAPLPAAPRDVQDIAFAVPGQGLITLGVFDKAGKLVRTLHALDGEEAFRIGLNGYVTQWDGCDDSGQKVPAGRYFVRGYLVGDVTVEGEAFHFNDWATSESSPIPRRIADFALLPGGDVLLVGTTPSGEGLCGRYSNEKGFLWSRELPPPSISGFLFAAADRVAVLHSGEGWHVFSLEDGSGMDATFLPPDAQPSSLAASGDHVYFVEGKAIRSVSISGGHPPRKGTLPLFLTRSPPLKKIWRAPRKALSGFPSRVVIL